MAVPPAAVSGAGLAAVWLVADPLADEIPFVAVVLDAPTGLDGEVAANSDGLPVEEAMWDNRAVDLFDSVASAEELGGPGEPFEELDGPGEPLDELVGPGEPLDTLVDPGEPIEELVGPVELAGPGGEVEELVARGGVEEELVGPGGVEDELVAPSKEELVGPGEDEEELAGPGGDDEELVGPELLAGFGVPTKSAEVSTTPSPGTSWLVLPELNSLFSISFFM